MTAAEATPERRVAFRVLRRVAEGAGHPEFRLVFQFQPELVVQEPRECGQSLQPIDDNSSALFILCEIEYW